MGNQPYIVGVGAANLDLNGASCAPIHLRDSNPGHISLSAGGVTRNVCENLARLGADVKLRDGRKLTDMELPLMGRIALKEALKKIEGTDLEKFLRQYNAI